MIQDIKAAMFEFTTVDEVVNKHGATELLPACTYTTPEIPIYGEPCANPLVTQSHTLTHPAIYTAEVSNYKMIGGCAFPIVDDKCVKPQLFNANEWETWEQTNRACLIRENIIAYRGFVSNITQDENETYINLIGNGSFNYAHWMTEFLPQLVLLKSSGLALNKFKYLISVHTFESMIDTLNLLGIDNNQLIKVPDLSFNQIKKCTWISPVANVVFQRPDALRGGQDAVAFPSHAIFHPDVLRATSDYYLNKLNIDKTSEAELIYIARTPGRKANQRIVLNEQYIQDELVKLGFVIIDPSKLSFQEQVKKFSNAKCIVSPSGAALINMLWAPPGAKIIVMMNDSKVVNYWYFSTIASCLGHKLSYVLGKAFSTGAWTDINHADFLVNYNEIVKAISAVEINVKDKSIFEYSCKLDKFRKFKFAFLIHEPVVLAHYKDVLSKLDKNHFCILTKVESVGTPNSNVDAFYQYLNQQGYSHTTLAYAINNGIRFPYVITNHVISNYYGEPMPKMVAKKQIRFMYGADVGDGWSLQPWNAMYDYFLCHGVNDKKAIESRFKGKTFIMGYPRYDSFFDSKLDTQSIKDEFNLDPAKKTILWVPTLGGDYSSIPRYAEKLKHLIGKYNFIIRPHPISFVQEPDFIALLESCGYLIDRNAIRDMNALYKVSDLVLADNGGSPFSAIFMGKNVVFLEVPEDLGKNQNSFHIVNTSVYELKKHLPVIKENDTQRLEQLLNSEEFYSENSKIVEAMFKQFFDCPRGGGAQRVADILNSLE